jgi:hypothetical protein
MRLFVTGEWPIAVRFPVRSVTLLSGGAKGAEAAFGACAELFGLNETNFSFAGRPTARTRGLVELNEEELKLGDVSPAYLRRHMARTYPDTPLFRKVLQSIWHQVNTASQVFVVGVILPDDTVKGGTGWAAELAKHTDKAVFIFDQERERWFQWTDGWTEVTGPKITSTRFTGTGTRFLNDAGQAAILALFERSFQ